jgi:hypothetical protein
MTADRRLTVLALVATASDNRVSGVLGRTDARYRPEVRVVTMQTSPTPTR